MTGASFGGSNAARCEDCGFDFYTERLAEMHAASTGHMARRYCDPCRTLFDDPRALHRHQWNDISNHQPHDPLPGAPSEISLSPFAGQPPVPPSHWYHWRLHGDVQDASTSFNQPYTDHDIVPPHIDRPTPAQQHAECFQSGFSISSEARSLPTNPALPTRPVDASQQYAESATSHGASPRELRPQSRSYPDGGIVDSQKPSDRRDNIGPPEPRSLVFLTPPQYPYVDVSPAGSVHHGNNEYMLFSTADQELLFQAVKLRRVSIPRLAQKKFLTPSNYGSWARLSTSPGMNPADFIVAPARSNRLSRRVVALDCEMVSVLHGRPQDKGERSELAQLCAIDVLTGEVLIDKLIRPRERVTNWRTRWSGVSWAAILAASSSGRLLHGWKSARTELLRYIDSDTILIGHDIIGDVQILRLAHANIVDTSVQTAEAVWGEAERFDRIWSLKDLAKSLTNLSIQAGKKGHDCVEDTFATREVALWCIRCPKELEAWANRTRADLQRKKIEAEKKRFEKLKMLEKECKSRDGLGSDAKSD
ncbi:hypothetical protein JX265_013317 [Neoarthrinium moseri]|uniref:C2H2-type domain-containing protein n=1 Tax=Neoarthrinium moseri TaxID=1658444 RepID=A0A9P9W941_9PEZI|nr:hypothetical protein JX266_010432 [Neoarthrinium moseri]KAI1850837.1 hypothetical protein JX265_013317 [Neoarthrinium moseri]